MILGQGAVLGIGLNIYAVNNFSGPAAQAQASMKALQNEFTQTWTENLRTLRNFYTGLATASAFALKGMASWVTEGAKFDYTMKGVQVASESTSSEYITLSEEAVKLGKTYMFTSQEVAEAMKVMALAGYGAKDLSTGIDAMVAAAGASMEPLKESTDVITNVMSMYGIAGEQAMRVSDLMSKAAIGSKADLLTLGEAIAYAGATLTSLKIPLEESLAMLMIMHDVGIRGSMAGTSVKNMFDYLAKMTGQFKTGRQDKALVALGLTSNDFKDAQGNLKTTGELVKVLAQAALKQNTIGQKTLFQAMFGMRGERAAIKFIQDTDKINKNIKDLYNLPEGFALKNMGEMMNTTQGDILRMKAAWDAFKISFTHALVPILRPILWVFRQIASVIEWIGSTWLGGWLLAIVSGWLAIKTVMWACKAVLYGIMIAFTTQRVTFENMKTAQLMGWAQLRAAVLGYRNAIIGTNIAMGTATTVGGMTSAGIPYMMNKAGRAYYPAGTVIGGANVGGRMVSKSAMAANRGGGILGALGLGSLFGRSAATSAAASTVTMGSAVSTILGIASKVLPPLLLAFGLYEYMRSTANATDRQSEIISDNTAAIKSNTALQEAKIKAEQKVQALRGTSDSYKYYKGLPTNPDTFSRENYGGVKGKLYDMIMQSGVLNPSTKGTITINVDGVVKGTYKTDSLYGKDLFVNGFND
jgi:TP901 family phage tail tape measure protein